MVHHHKLLSFLIYHFNNTISSYTHSSFSRPIISNNVQSVTFVCSVFRVLIVTPENWYNLIWCLCLLKWKIYLFNWFLFVLCANHDYHEKRNASHDDDDDHDTFLDYFCRARPQQFWLVLYHYFHRHRGLSMNSMNFPIKNVCYRSIKFFSSSFYTPYTPLVCHKQCYMDFCSIHSKKALFDRIKYQSQISYEHITLLFQYA